MIRKIAVCDDEKSMLRQLSGYLGQIQQEIEDSFEVFYFASAEELLKHMDRCTELVLLDISMGETNGMDCARTLRTEGFSGDIFFITSMENFAIEGYEVQAFAFLTKPVTYAELKDRLIACFKKRDKSRAAVLPIETSHGTEIVPINNILYAEVFQHKTSFILSDERTLESAIQLSEIDTQLSPHGFFRCHRSYLVNMKHISKIASTELTVGSKKIVPLSKHRNKEFLAAYTKFMGVNL